MAILINPQCSFSAGECPLTSGNIMLPELTYGKIILPFDLLLHHFCSPAKSNTRQTYASKRGKIMG
jgi:hypothetical protein